MLLAGRVRKCPMSGVRLSNKEDDRKQSAAGIKPGTQLLRHRLDRLVLGPLLHGFDQSGMVGGALVVFPAHLDQLPKHRRSIPAFKGRELGALARQIGRRARPFLIGRR